MLQAASTTASEGAAPGYHPVFRRIEHFNSTALRNLAGQARVLEAYSLVCERLVYEYRAIIDMGDTTPFIGYGLNDGFNRLLGQTLLAPSFSRCRLAHVSFVPW
jgi:hypothetical protein